MVLPDYGSGIFTYLNAFLNWSPFSIMVTVFVAVACVGVVVSVFMRAFMRG